MDPTLEEPGQEPEAAATSITDALAGSPAAPEAAPQEQPAAQSAEAPAASAAPADNSPFWYRKELKKFEGRAKAAERRLEELSRQPPPAQPGAAEVDFSNPEAAQGYFTAALERQALVGRLERSEERFTDKHGDQAFQECRDWLATRPDIEEWALKQRDPWAAAHQQYSREKLSAEIGDDPESWRTKETERIRAELMAEMGQAPAEPQMRPTLPKPGATMPSAAPRDQQGRFTGPTPISAATRNKF